MFFSVITKNLNREILTKNLGMGLRMKNFDIMGIHLKIRFLMRGSRKSNILGETV